MKSSSRMYWLLVIAVAGAVLCSGCAGSKSKGAGSSEVVFTSPSDSSKTSTAKRTSDEDDVLRLLGINKSAAPASDTTTVQIPASSQDLEARVQKLDGEVRQRNEDLTALKSELSERDRRITTLQDQLNRPGKKSEEEVAIPAAGFKNRYEAARKMYEAKKYRPAIDAFEKLLQSGGDKTLLDNCQYWIGECYYGMNYYNQAIVEFEKVFTYSDTDKYDDAQLKLGLCHLRIGHVEKAKSEFEKLLSNYPESEYVQRAKEYLARL
jgi:tol-pal system protein YbgF